MGHVAWIWAILLGFGPYSLDLGPKGDEALRMGLRGGDVRTDGRTDGQIPLVFYRTLSPSGPLPKKHVLKVNWDNNIDMNEENTLSTRIYARICRTET